MRVEIPNTIAVTLHGLVSRGVKAAEVTDEGHLVLTLTDGSRGFHLDKDTTPFPR